jgi:RimJ/RimL family protein N-acetyltransferase
MSPAAEPRTVLQTERLRLREFGIADAEFIVELLNDEEFLRYIGDRGVRTTEDAREYIRSGPIASYDRDGIGIWLVIRIEDSRLVGTCGLLRRDELDAPDVGFAFLPDYRSQGYGYESARAVLDHATETLGIARVLGVTQTDNTASIALLEKLGLRYEDVVRLDDKGPDLAMYSTVPRPPVQRPPEPRPAKPRAKRP